jgi:chromosome segregation ATPase
LSDDTARPAEVTQNYYRFRVELKPFAKVVFPVTERQALMDSYQLTKLSRDNLDLFIRQRSINDDVRQKLEKLIDLRARVSEIEEKLKTLEAEETAISEDQARLRENIEALAKTPEAKQLIARYIAKANEQETRIEQITKERQTLIAERERLERELAAAIRAFEI